MLGAIAGDIIGSVYEARPIKTTRFRLFHPLCRFTDDTVLTVALADSLLHGAPFVGLLKQYYRAYPHAGYGGSFHQWAQSEDSRPYNSWGNGSAMRVSPVGFAFDTLDEVLAQAQAECRGDARPPRGDQGGAGGRLGGLPRPHRAEQGADQGLRGAAFGYDLDTTAGRDPPHVRVPGLVPEVRAAGDPGVPGVGRLRGCRAEGDLAWAGTATRWPAWRAGSPRRFTVACPR